MDKVFWQLPPEELSIDADQIHIWRLWLDLPDQQLEYLRRILSEDQIQRGRRFRFLRDKKRFIAAQGLIREILSRYLALAPERIRFVYNKYGKPDLEERSKSEGWHFNLSHSEDVALLGISGGFRVGVDIERIKPDRATEDIARRFFSPNELDTLITHPEDQRIAAFYRCWTRKEAYIKAHGEGLSIPLDQFEVSISLGEPPHLINIQGNVDEASRWSLHHLEPMEGYVAALAVEGHPKELNYYQWWGWPNRSG
jgi:4'-phosphopantetheinyl transferase